MMVRVALAEDQGMVRDALARLLQLEPGFSVIGTTEDGAGALALADLGPDVILLDIEMPVMDGLEACRAIRAAHPDVRVVMLTTFGRPGYLREAMEAGAAGFLLKDDPVPVLAAKLRRIVAGETVVDPALAVGALRAGPSPLSAREREVLRAALDGRPVSEIARSLHLGEGTVRNHLSTIIQKLGVQNRAQAARRAEENGWL